MILSNVYATFLLVIAQITARGNAQRGVADWMWKFGSGETGEAGFDECQRVPLLIIPGKISPSGVPPYYLLAFEVGGTPTTQMIGSSSTELLWTVDHKQGTQLLITVMDSTRTIGGIPPTPYNIHAGHDTSCFPPSPQNPPIIHPNVTGTLRNCEPWGLSVTGGKKPYTIVFAAANNPVLENGTMGANDNVYTYINRSKPDRQLMASVADADGQWGQSTQLIETIGDTDFDCGSQVSSSSTSAQTTQQDKKDVRLIAGLSAGLGIAAVLAIAALFRVVRRRTQKRNKLRIRSNSDTSVSLFEESAADMTQVYPEDTTGHQPKASVRISCAITPLRPSHELMQASSSSPSDFSYTQNKTYGAGSPLSPTYPQSPTTLSPTFVGTTTHTPDSQPLISTTGRGNNGIEELPPPYMERSARSARSSQPSFAPLSTAAGVPGVSAGSNVAGTPGEVSPSLEGAGTSGLGRRI